MLLTLHSAANNFKISHIETTEAKSLLDSAKVIYIGGFFLTVSRETIEKVAQAAVASRKVWLQAISACLLFQQHFTIFQVFCMNLSAPFIVQFFAEALASVMPYTDVIFCNESEVY